VGLLFLFIGLFIFIRRWNAPRAVHFYVFCLVSFICWSFHYSGKFDAFDWEVYWAEIVARLLAPALLLHFALVFPGRSETTVRSSAKLTAVYVLPFFLLLIHVNTALKANGFVPWLASYLLLTKFGIWLPGALLSGCGDWFLPQLPGSPVRRSSAASYGNG